MICNTNKRNNQYLNLVFIIILISSLPSCKKNIDHQITNGLAFTQFSLQAKNNVPFISKNIQFTINDNKLNGRTMAYADIGTLVPYFITSADSVTVNGKLVESGITPVDFTKPLVYTLHGKDGQSADYSAHLTNFTDLPVIYIRTKGGQLITSKDAYIGASISINSNNQYPYFEDSIQIKGHGNSTWIEPKKPYKFKFDKKHSLLGMATGKPWILLANAFDTTGIRNETSMSLGRISNLDWTPNMRFAELFLNGTYKGTYQLAEQVKINDNRVNISDDGYLLEIDQPSRLDDDDISFKTSRMTVVIKDPDIDPSSTRYTYIKNKINKIENILYGENFNDPTEGYAKYLDVSSFVDWYLINEISKNNDAVFYSSCYMNIAPGGKLKMGPIWDYDLAFGNYTLNGNHSPEGLWVMTSVWISRLFEDPTFVQKVKTRFKYFREAQDAIVDTMQQNANLLKWSAFQNNSKWRTLSQNYLSEQAIWKSYSQQIFKLDNWYNTRMDWLQDAFDKM